MLVNVCCAASSSARLDINHVLRIQGLGQGSTAELAASLGGVLDPQVPLAFRARHNQAARRNQSGALPNHIHWEFSLNNLPDYIVRWRAHLCCRCAGAGACDSRRVQDAGTPELLLEGGMAFGTGEHATTKLCCKWLQRQARDGYVTQMTN
jgi:hypothetical protein